MALPFSATVEAAPNFLPNLESAHQFFILQDKNSLLKLKAGLREMCQILAWSPAGGRPARFVDAKSAQARLKAGSLKALAERAALPNLREYVVGQHIVLYAHSDSEVVLLSLKHQRQLVYAAES